jgi:hypothetical protein
MLVLFPCRGMTSSRVFDVSALIKVWNPSSQPLQITGDGGVVPGMSAADADPGDEYVTRALKAGLVWALSTTEVEEVAPVTASQVTDSAEVVATDVVPAEPQVESEGAPEAETPPVEEPKTNRTTRTKSQASKES